MKESSSYKWIVLGNIMIGTFMAVLDSTVVNTGLPVIMGTLGADINVAEWVLTHKAVNGRQSPVRRRMPGAVFRTMAKWFFCA